MSWIWFVTSGMKKETFSFFYVANGCYLTSFFLFFRKVPFWLSNMCKNSKKWSILIRPQELLTAASLLLEDTRHSLIGNAIGLRLEKTNSAYTDGILKSIPFLRQCCARSSFDIILWYFSWCQFVNQLKYHQIVSNEYRAKHCVRNKWTLTTVRAPS